MRIEKRGLAMSYKSKLQKLVEEATLDTYGLDEPLWGFLAVLEDKLEFPFKANVVGEEVEITAIDYNGNQLQGIVALCKRKGREYKVSLSDIEVSHKIKGGKWIEAYQHWFSDSESE